jgi:hypothetical protein
MRAYTPAGVLQQMKGQGILTAQVELRAVTAHGSVTSGNDGRGRHAAIAPHKTKRLIRPRNQSDE